MKKSTVRVNWKQGFWSGILTALAVLPTVSTAAAAQTPQSKQWKVHPYGSFVGGWTITVGADVIRLESEQADRLQIPVSQVMDVSYSDLAQQRGHLDGWAVLAYWPVLPLLLIPDGKDHVIHIFWNQEVGISSVLRLYAGKRDSAELLAELEKVTGKQVHNLPLMTKQSKRETNQEKNRSIPISLGTQACLTYWVSGFPLDWGSYQMVLLRGDGSNGQLFFFQGEKVSLGHVSAMSPVEIIPRGKEAPLPAETDRAVEYGREDSPYTCTMTEIHTATEILRFPETLPVMEVNLNPSAPQVPAYEPE